MSDHRPGHLPVRCHPLRWFIGVLLLAFPGAIGAAAQGLVINELMPDNGGLLFDEDGDTPDWIELFNAGPGAVDLAGYALSDDPDDPRKWVLGSYLLPSGAHALVLASGKDRPGFLGHWESVVDQGDMWRYYVGEAPPPAGWSGLGFEDAAWPEGPSGFGYGDGDDATEVPQTTVLYARTTFHVDDPEAVRHAVLHVDYDDGFVAYLNGEEVGRANVAGDVPGHTQRAEVAVEARLFQSERADKFEIEDPTVRLRPGENVLSVQVHDASVNSTDLTLIPFLTLGLTRAPSDGRGGSEMLRGELDRSHASFRLDAGGEEVLLSAPDGRVVDRWVFGALPRDISYGRYPDGEAGQALFDAPTPGRANDAFGYEGRVARPVFSEPAGGHAGEIRLRIQAEDPEAVISYTTDGSVPGLDDPPYTVPLSVTEPTVVRARAFRAGFLPSEVETATYLVGETTGLPIASLVTEPDSLFGEERGIYALGPNALQEYPYTGANFLQLWEVPVHVEFFEPDGRNGFAADMGVRIHGAASRLNDQKSFALFARSQYGPNVVEYPLFPGHPVTKFDSFLLRNTGNDFMNARLRDPLVHRLVSALDLDVLASRPVVVFINGAYWGQYYLREKANEDYLAAHHGVDPDSIDLIEGTYHVIEGNRTHYQAMLDYIEAHDIAEEEHYEVVQSMMEVDNFIDYQITEIYSANVGWPSNNVKSWRPQRPGGRWRWILFDTDFSFNMGSATETGSRSLERVALTDSASGAVEPRWTFLFRSLLENDGFRTAFVNRFADHLNDTFAPERVLAVVDTLVAALEPEMPRHFDRWPGTLSRWDEQIDMVRSFARERPDSLRTQLREFFGLGPLRPVSLDRAAPGGHVRIHRLDVEAFPWTGTYFAGTPVAVAALPEPGYRFSHWTGSLPESQSRQRVLEVDPATAPTLVAHFEVEPADPPPPVVFNEIHYTSAPVFDAGDWVELYNAGTDTVDLGGWIFSDGDDRHGFALPPGLTLPPDGYVVLCRDLERFRAVHLAVAGVVGGWSFGLNSAGERVRLFDAGGAVVDSLTFASTAPWPRGTAGQGYTLELTSPHGDNARPEAWGRSQVRGGTPGAANSVFVGVDEAPEASPAEAPVLDPAYPNPFYDRVVFGYRLSAPGWVELAVYDVLGRRVAAWEKGLQPASAQQMEWAAEGVSQGMYFVQLWVDGVLRATQPVMHVR